MTQDSSAIWHEIMSNWQTSQKQAAENMLKGFEAWNNAFNPGNASSSNPMLDTFQSINQSFLKHYSPMMQSGIADNWQNYFKGMPDAKHLSFDIKKLMESGQKLFESMTSQFPSSFVNDEANQYLIKALMDMSNPESWSKYCGDNFDLSAHKLSEGPLFSGISDIDQRFSQASDSWRELFEANKKYHAIVFAKWTKAYSKFLDKINKLDKEQLAELSPRKLIDIWTEIANQELLELHRSEEFLHAQRGVIRASMKYRLHEKNVAEVICEAMHIPTRDEVDELHKVVTTLRRELRDTKKLVQDLHKDLAGAFSRKLSAKEK